MAVNRLGVLLPTTQNYDPEQILTLDVNSEEFKLFLVYLYEQNNLIATHTNLKDTGYYALGEYLNGQQYFSDPTLNSSTPIGPQYRSVFRTVVNFGALPNTALKSVAHNIDEIDSNVTFTRIYGAASDGTALSFIPIPFASPVLTENIKITVNNTNVNITTGSNRASYTNCYVVLEYIRS